MSIPIEQQVAELTPEQRNNIGKIYKNYVLSLVVTFLVGVALIIGIFAYASIKENLAEDKYNRIQTEIELNEMNNKYDLSLLDESSEAFDEYYDMKQLKPMALMIGCGVIFIGILVLGLVFKGKYPYFSEKKYTYLKKLEKDLNQE